MAFWKGQSGFAGKTIGISLDTDQTEAEAGDFNADILAKDEDGNYVIIENQLEATDHKHLGQIIAYASGKEAKLLFGLQKNFVMNLRRRLNG
jgi:hypothetical protein